MSNQKFDFTEANQLKAKLGNGKCSVEAELSKMMTMVQGVKSWWSGGSEDAFIENFKITKDNIVKSLNQCFDDYKKLVDQIARAKQESDDDIARQLKR